MFPTNLAGTVDAYDRHVVLFNKSSEDLAARVEGSGSDPLRKLLSSAVKARQRVDISVKTKVTVCEGREGTDFADGDVLILPDMIEHRGLKESDVDSFVDDVIVNGKSWASGAQEALTGSHVFVCARGSRDCRYGVCGPVLVEEADLLLKDQIFDSPCSHIGGHKYGVNLMICRPGADGMITGHWYRCVGRHEWRGQMGVSAEEAEKASEDKLPNGEEPKESKEKPQENQSFFKQVPEEKGSNAQVIETKRKFEEVKSSVKQRKKMKFEEKQRWTNLSSSWLSLGSMSIDPSRASMMSIDPSMASMMSIDPSMASMMSIDPSIGSN